MCAVSLLSFVCLYLFEIATLYLVVDYLELAGYINLVWLIQVLLQSQTQKYLPASCFGCI